MKPQSEPLALMSQPQRTAYAASCLRMAKKARGRLAEHLKAAARTAQGENFYPAQFADNRRFA